MATLVRSFSKINLGLAIGPPRPDGFHALSTVYQTLALFDTLHVTARRAEATRITLASTDRRVPTDSRNTVWKMVERTLSELGLRAEVEIHITKNLPVQGGMGAGSANAAAALLGLERELGLELPETQRLGLAAGVGSDVPLFLIGGSVLGSDRGQMVRALPDVTFAGEAAIPCVVALPALGVSTPLAFRAWDQRFDQKPASTELSGPGAGAGAARDLHNLSVRDTLSELSRTYVSVFGLQSGLEDEPNESELSLHPPDSSPIANSVQGTSENLQDLSGEQRHRSLRAISSSAGESDQARMTSPANLLQALVARGLENDFETVVFAQHPLLGEIKHHLLGASAPEPGEADGGAAIFASLSGSGSALFGLYRTPADAAAAQQRLQKHGVPSIVTTTLPRSLYWSKMFAE